jgi:hypothetical protein
VALERAVSEMADKRIPPVSRDLIEYLEKAFPERSPSINDSGRKIWMDAGKVDVIRHIRALYEKQERTVISTL